MKLNARMKKNKTKNRVIILANSKVKRSSALKTSQSIISFVKLTRPACMKERHLQPNSLHSTLIASCANNISAVYNAEMHLFISFHKIAKLNEIYALQTIPFHALHLCSFVSVCIRCIGH